MTITDISIDEEGDIGPATTCSSRSPRSSQNRRDEFKLTEKQREHLGLIIKAIEDGNYDRFSELLCSKRDFVKNLLNVYINGQTALHHSIINGRDVEWCKQLIKNGANPNLTNRTGWHPIHLAAYRGSPETMVYLLDCVTD